ncbi:TPA: EAL domain-containing protein [Escherichia coli]|uniref:EAL domain-containing protein n=1 Tax=Escherichia coli TaxID=562 RepID=UPI000C1457CB|nr:EAL domain-containing protein [Escherichia coli]EEW4265760.1 EAL domain-containing protein [Escherichia coli]EEW4320455.1 EAL domain-containing protein [Escherichia coli]HBA6686433.1 EAL domain-containing protein [Escherichia coli]HBA6714993.1 EAL domain-containing protein [Escherichia coli]
MASHDLSVFLEEFGATVNLTLPGIVSEKERLLLKLLMEGMSVTEISQYRNRSAKTISHQKKQLYEKLGIQSDITFWRDIFFQYHPQVISGTGNKNNFYIPDNRCHHIVTPEAISLALENHEFKPWIQPVFCAQTGVLTGCEVLVRWEHPQTGIIPPDQFIPLAESSGLIVIMTRQLMKQTADILMPVKHLLLDNFHIGINVSAGCFLAAGFEKECLNLVKKLGNDKIKLVLELTERNPIPVTPEARAIFDSLHQHNITFALDDFGTGYATYRYLQAFPVDFIKIDKSFVQMASVDEISGHIVDNIVELARKPGLSIVAEGVETQEQADLMIGKGVHFLQGYLYSPPVPGNKFISEWVMKAGG